MEQDDVLDRAEALDSYRAACEANQANRLAREGQVYQLSEISPQALTALQDAAGEIQLLDGCELAILDSSADAGFPHTRPKNLICLPAKMCTESISSSFKITLIHEAIHIHQRAHVVEWNTACRQVGWTPVDSEQIPSEFRERVRINPDTMMKPFWAWQTHNVPLPLFRGTPRLQGTDVQWLDLRMGTLFHDAPKSFVKVYGEAIHQPEHPYEIYAELFSNKYYTTSDSILENLKTL
jgi:hypothetical protein